MLHNLIANRFYTKKYKIEFENAGSDCNKIDILYENLPPPILVKLKLKDEILFEHLQALLSCTITNWGAVGSTNESVAIINLLKGFVSTDFLFKKLKENPEIVTKLYSKVDKENKSKLVLLITELCLKHGEVKSSNYNFYLGNLPKTNIQYLIYGDNTDIQYFVNGEIKGNSFSLTNTIVWTEVLSIKGYRESPWEKEFRETTKGKGLLKDQMLSFDTPVKVSLIEDKNSYIYPAIALMYIADKRLDAIKQKGYHDALTALEIFGSLAILKTPGAGGVMRFFALVDIPKVLINRQLDNENVKKQLAKSEKGKSFLTVWPKISGMIDIGLMAGPVYELFVASEASAAAALRLEATEESNLAANYLDDLANQERATFSSGVGTKLEQSIIDGLLKGVDKATIDYIGTMASKEQSLLLKSFESTNTAFAKEADLLKNNLTKLTVEDMKVWEQLNTLGNDNIKVSFDFLRKNNGSTVDQLKKAIAGDKTLLKNFTSYSANNSTLTNNLNIWETTEAALVTEFKKANSTLLPANVKAELNKLLTTDLVGNSTTLEAAREKIVSKVNEIIGRNITHQQFELMEVIPFRLIFHQLVYLY